MRKSILTLGIAAVLTGVLATCSMAYAADDELAQIQESGKLKVAFVIPDVVDTYAVPIKKGETALYDAVQNAINELKEDGTLSKLSEDYFGTDFTQPQDENAANTDTASEDATAESTDEN